MNRLGWTILLLILIAGAGFALLSTSGSDADPANAEVETPRVAEIMPSGLVIPVAGVPPDQLANSWHDEREAGARAHEAIDIAAPGGTPVLAAQAGRVEKLFESRQGGTTVYVRSEDGNWIGYYAHLAGYAPGLTEGLRVVRGQQIGFVGDTGNAGAGNTHLHFGLHRMAPGEKWHQGTPVNPYPLLAGKPAGR